MVQGWIDGAKTASGVVQKGGREGARERGSEARGWWFVDRGSWFVIRGWAAGGWDPLRIGKQGRNIIEW